jgi:hypothetical protein
MVMPETSSKMTEEYRQIMVLFLLCSFVECYAIMGQ